MMTKEQDQRFPLKLGSLWRAVWLGVLVGGSAYAAFDWMMGRPFSLRPTVVMAAAAAVTCAILYFTMSTRANSQRLLIADKSGVPRELRWIDVTEVTLMKYWGQPHWRITSTGGKHFWLSRDTKNLRRLYEMARKHGGENHPLVKALERPIYEHE
jgi:hypothetical protein